MSDSQVIEQVTRSKDCPFCGESILAKASKCKHCGSSLSEANVADIGARLGASAIDYGIIMVFVMVASFFIGFFQIRLFSFAYMQFLIFSSLACLAYMTVLPATFGGTLGKLALGLRIVQMDGSPIGFGRAVARYLLYWMTCWVFFGALFLVIAFRSDKRAIHDLIVGTKVVRVNHAAT